MSGSRAASLEVADLGFRYPGAEELALDGVGFSVAPGERVGLLGPNGAGKSTLMRLICGYLAVQHHRQRPRPRLEVAGHDVASDSHTVRGLVGYLPEQVPLYLELRVLEHLDFRAQIKRVPRKTRRREIDRVAELTGLARMLETPIHKLSRGYRQRVGIADALLGAPPLVVLDEPTVGLDPNQVQAIRAMLRALGGEQTLIFSSHILAEVEALCDRIVILSRGRVVADEDVATAMAAGSLVLELAGAPAAVEATLRPLLASPPEAGPATGPAAEGDAAPGPTLRVEALRGGWSRAVLTGVDASESSPWPERLGAAAMDAGLALRRLERGRRPLEARFAEVTGALGPEAGTG